ncbi:hypothetical protein KVT40_000830 [Elsinoe batatas]|uniref:Uncharacterized protein n=1 Tax=Elsinoe batatas TaxID=2601811 RepID=A0A8K0LCR9_9PEZI|nr:hypothetical protein KVT40_000830 [Elsinoe batatas]
MSTTSTSTASPFSSTRSTRTALLGTLSALSPSLSAQVEAHFLSLSSHEDSAFEIAFTMQEKWEAARSALEHERSLRVRAEASVRDSAAYLAAVETQRYAIVQRWFAAQRALVEDVEFLREEVRDVARELDDEMEARERCGAGREELRGEVQELEAEVAGLRAALEWEGARRVEVEREVEREKGRGQAQTWNVLGDLLRETERRARAEGEVERLRGLAGWRSQVEVQARGEELGLRRRLCEEQQRALRMGRRDRERLGAVLADMQMWKRLARERGEALAVERVRRRALEELLGDREDEEGEDDVREDEEQHDEEDEVVEVEESGSEEGDADDDEFEDQGSDCTLVEQAYGPHSW